MRGWLDEGRPGAAIILDSSDGGWCEAADYWNWSKATKAQIKEAGLK